MNMRSLGALTKTVMIDVIDMIAFGHLDTRRMTVDPFIAWVRLTVFAWSHFQSARRNPHQRAWLSWRSDSIARLD